MPSPSRKPGDAKPDAAQARCDKADGCRSRSPDDAADDADDDAPPIIAPEKSARSPSGLYEFREERWVELYTKKIEEMIGVLKSKGVPVLWVGLPAVRGPKATADMLFLDSLYRDAAGKAGITYVDVWDGFVDEAGRFLQQGPDFEGQIRRLRSDDGVYFTKAGARKLAHYVEREITRLLAARSGPIALPTEPATPDANALPGQPAPRPLAGPILPLVASSVGTDQLLGGPGSRPAAVDALAARTLVKGEPLAPPAGRADDFAWPRREVGREQAKGDTPVAAASPGGTVAAAPGQSSFAPPPQQTLQQQRAASAADADPAAQTARRRCAISSAVRHRRRASRRRRQPRRRGPSRPARRARRVMSGGRRSVPPGNFARSTRTRQSHSRRCLHPGTRIARRTTISDGSAVNSASAAADGAAGASSAAPAQSRCRLRPAARRADCPAPSSPPLASRRERCRRCSRRRPWRS